MIEKTAGEIYLESLGAVPVPMTQEDLNALLRSSRKERWKDYSALGEGRKLALEKVSEYMWTWSNHRGRMGDLISFRLRMDHEDWLALLGEFWNMCDNIRDYSSILRSELGTIGPLMPMMTPEERIAYAALPDVLTVYRGCSAQRLTGASWSLDPEVARAFPTLNRYRVSDPVLVTATVPKSKVLAILLSREEQEVITFNARRLRVEPIEAIRR